MIKGMTNKEYYRQYRLANKEKLDAYHDKYRKEHRDYFANAAKKQRERHPEMVRVYRANRRARIKGSRVEKHIRLAWLHNWDSRICGICIKPIKGEYQVDHIVPLSKGGEHSVKNLQLAHPFCNRSKHNRLPNPQLVVS